MKEVSIPLNLTLDELRQYRRLRLKITLDVKGLTPGRHGVHLHQTGKCEPEFTAAGGHFDPGPASNTDPDANHPFHMGDIPNLEVGSDGRGQMKILTSRVTLSEGPLSVFDADGTPLWVLQNVSLARGLQGIGGGMITNPLLLEAGLSPERVSATGSVIIGRHEEGSVAKAGHGPINGQVNVFARL